MNGVRKSETLAIVSLVLGAFSLSLGILSLTCFGLLAGIPAVIAGISAIITGIVAYSRARRLPEQYGRAGYAVAGLLMGCFGFCAFMLSIGVLLFLLANAKR